MEEYSEKSKRERLLGGQPLRFPPELSAEQRSIDPAWIIEAVAAGRTVDVENAVITEPLDLESQHVSRPLSLVNSRCPGIDLRYATFAQVVRLDRTAFNGGADLHAARFERDLWIEGAQFGESLDLSDCVVGVGLHAARATFHGDANCDGVRVGHDATFVAASFEGEAVFQDARIGGSAVFTGATFKQQAAFDRMRVAESLFCSPATFEGAARFPGVQVEGTADFKDATFKQRAAFDGMRVAESLFCSPATFEGEARFPGVQVGGQAVFVEATFGGEAVFSNTQFAGPAFMRAKFAGPVHFDGATFTQGLYVQEREFAGPVDFRTATIKLEARFDGCAFRDAADFSGCSVDGDMVCLGTTFAGRWDLTGARLSKFLVDDDLGMSPSGGAPDRFAGDGAHADLRGCTYDRIQAHWYPLLRSQQPYDRQPYTQFERTLRAIGRDDLADGVYYHRRRLEGDMLKPFRSRPWTGRFWRDLLRWVGDRSLRLLAGYGVRPGWTVAFLVAVPVLAALLFLLSNGAVQPERAGRAFMDCNAAVNGWDALWLSLASYLPFDVATPGAVAATDCPTVLGVRASAVASVEKILGWLLIPISVATFSGLIRYAGGRD